MGNYLHVGSSSPTNIASSPWYLWVDEPVWEYGWRGSHRSIWGFYLVMYLPYYITLISNLWSYTPMYTRARVESSNLQFMGVWHLELMSFHPNLTLFRTWAILKLLTSGEVVKWPCSRWPIKGGWCQKQRRTIWQVKECMESHWLGPYINENLSSHNPI